MGEKLQELVKLAQEVEADPGDTLKAAMLAQKVLDFSEEHVLTGTLLNSTGTVAEVMVPFNSPLRKGQAKIVSA